MTKGFGKEIGSTKNPAAADRGFAGSNVNVRLAGVGLCPRWIRHSHAPPDVKIDTVAGSVMQMIGFIVAAYRSHLFDVVQFDFEVQR